MGIKDQFQDKAQELAEKAKGAVGDRQDEASDRASQDPDEAQRAAQEQRDKFDRDYDA
ncbi:hypothetical protein [Streptomyces alboniger]|uniref:hypothetical protein n=1 Tax=Streptomyces alboniger TaxID=132473 RepID=UPI000A5249AF|nr:hypothetical protein [Streptomyces alboniger]